MILLRLIILLSLFIASAATAQMLLLNGGIQVGSGGSAPTGSGLLLVNGTDHVLLVNALDNLCLVASSSC